MEGATHIDGRTVRIMTTNYGKRRQCGIWSRVHPSVFCNERSGPRGSISIPIRNGDKIAFDKGNHELRLDLDSNSSGIGIGIEPEDHFLHSPTNAHNCSWLHCTWRKPKPNTQINTTPNCRIGLANDNNDMGATFLYNLMLVSSLSIL